MVGHIGGFLDSLVMRWADVMRAFPTLLLAFVVLYTVPGGLLTIIIVLTITCVAVFVRVARGEALVVPDRRGVR